MRAQQNEDHQNTLYISKDNVFYLNYNYMSDQMPLRVVSGYTIFNENEKSLGPSMTTEGQATGQSLSSDDEIKSSNDIIRKKIERKIEQMDLYLQYSLLEYEQFMRGVEKNARKMVQQIIQKAKKANFNPKKDRQMPKFRLLRLKAMGHRIKYKP